MTNRQRDQDWELPPIYPVILLNPGEMLLIDWILCGPSHILPEGGIQELLVWQPLRLMCWQGIRCDVVDYPLALPETDANILVALCPTTFRWGVGEDVGFTLKMKLAKFVAPEMFPNVYTEDDTQGEAPGEATGATADGTGV